MWSVLFATMLAVSAQGTRLEAPISAHQSAEIARIAAELDARSAADHRGKARALYSTGRTGPFVQYVRDCLNRIVPDSGSGADASQLIDPRNSVLFSLSIRADGSLKSVSILMNHGGPALEARLRSAIRRAQPFPPFPEAMRRTYHEVVITRTIEYPGCAKSGCRQIPSR